MSDALFLTAADVETSDRPETEPDGHRFYIVGFRADDNQPESLPRTIDSSACSERTARIRRLHARWHGSNRGAVRA